jgi:hypothetical protein
MNVKMREQQWLNDRLGNFTASRISELLASGKGKNEIFGDTAMTYIREIVAEMMTGERKPSAYSKSLEWGNDYEAEAMEAYIARTGYDVIYYGKENPVFFPINGMPAGGSPDGLIENERVIEIKCPYDTANHIEYCTMTVEEFKNSGKKHHKGYYAQVQLNMVATNVLKADFCSYDPRIIKDEYRLAILTVPFDMAFWKNMEARIYEAAEMRGVIHRTIIGERA